MQKIHLSVPPQWFCCTLRCSFWPQTLLSALFHHFFCISQFLLVSKSMNLGHLLHCFWHHLYRPLLNNQWFIYNQSEQNLVFITLLFLLISSGTSSVLILSMISPKVKVLNWFFLKTIICWIFHTLEHFI